jgi:hypothetical protein
MTADTPTPDAPDTRADLDTLIEEGREAISAHDYDMRDWASRTISALAAERDRADRAETRLAEAWDEGVNWAQESESDFPKSSVGNPYRTEATA